MPLQASPLTRFLYCRQVPLLQPYPLPRSVVTIDGASIHMCREFLDLVHQTGAIVVFMEPYDPEHHPIEVGFRALKAWLRRYRCDVKNLPFPQQLRLAAHSVKAATARAAFYESGFMHP